MRDKLDIFAADADAVYHRVLELDANLLDSAGGRVKTSSDGTVEDVVADCGRTLEIMMRGGGYCFAPTHQLQDNSPTENVIAMYETAHRFGRYD